MSPITLTYTSRRSEVWRWYWRLWRKKLWIEHALYLLCILAIAISLDGHWPPHKGIILYGLLAAAVVIAIYVLFPQLMFKPQERTLTVSEDGIETRIGKKSGTVKWNEITTIQDTPDITMITRKSGNTFLIPRRAFDSEEEKNEFLASVRAWQLPGPNALG